MPIWGVDIHPRYQAGINIETIRAEGFDFMAVKVSESTSSGFMSVGSADFLRRGKAAGLLCLGYHYLRAGNETAQALVFAEQLRTAGVPGMLDAEDGAGDITNIRRFIDACRRHGAHVPLMYLPRWYWDRIGQPSLAGLPPLWASRYVAGDSGPASVMYQRHNPAGWDSYGGGVVEILQFTDKAAAAGREIDANCYRGTREQFAALIGTQPGDDMPNPDDVWNYVIADPYVHAGGQQAEPKPAKVLLGYAAKHAANALEVAAAARAEAAGARSAIAELAQQVTAGDINADALVERLTQATTAAIAQAVIDVDVTVRGDVDTATT